MQESTACVIVLPHSFRLVFSLRVQSSPAMSGRMGLLRLCRRLAWPRVSQGGAQPSLVEGLGQ
jgi:hypothetical protein